MSMTRWLLALTVCAIVSAAQPLPTAAQQPDTGRYLAGKLLVATPEMTDPRFAETVIFMAIHDSKGALGFIVNKSYGRGGLGSFLRGFGADAKGIKESFDLHRGGPVSPGALFVLHSSDYSAPGSKAVEGTGVSFSTNKEIMRDIAEGKGPKRFLFALGYAGWGPQQLEGELARGSWTVSDSTEDIVFGNDQEIWKRLSGADGLPL